jgi:gliding motility-associated-like protein
MKKGLLLLAFISANIIYSQVNITVDTPPNLLQNVLIGSGVTVSNISSQGAANQFGSFTALPGTPLDFNYGIILTTFGITSPTVMDQTLGGYFGAGTPGDADLSATAGGGITTDAAWIQFDFIPTGDTMKFDYVFGSQEYNGYVNSGFNDVFAFYLTGPNPLGGSYTNQNVAVVPGTSVPVTINNVNNGNAGGCGSGPCEYCNFFVDNHNDCVPVPPASAPLTGGYTTNLRVVVPVVPCSTYTIKLGVADLLDQALNSFVMLKANSFISNQVTVSTESELLGIDTVVAADSVFYEGCTYTNLNFVRGGDLIGTDTVTFVIGGTATMGVDYPPFTTTIIFPPGEDTIQIPIQPIEDMILESMESITVSITDTICGNAITQTYTLFISDLGPMTIDAGSDTMACPGIPFNFNASANGGANIFGIQWQGPGSNTWDNDSTIQITTPGYYSVAVYEYCLDTTQYDSVYLAILQPPATNFNDFQACSGEPINIGTSAVAGYGMTWSPGTNLSSTTVSNPVFNGINLGITPLVFTYTIQLDSSGYQCFSDSVTVTLFNTPIVEIGDSIEECEGTLINLNAGNPGLAYSWSTGASTQSIVAGNSGLYAVTVSLPGTSCSGSDSAFIQIYPRFNLNLPNQQVCSEDALQVGITPLAGVNYTWSPASNLDNPNVGNPIFSGTNPGPGSINFTYYLAVDSGGFTCSFDTITVTLNPNPDVVLADTTILCENGVVNLNSGIPLASYLWNTGATTQSIVVNTPGVYGVVATYPTTCFDSDSTVVVLDSLPHFQVNDVTVCEGDSAVLWVNPNEGSSFLWSTLETTPSIFTFTPGTYILAVSNSCGSTTDTALVVFKPDLQNIPLPNVLTTNDDGINDTYYIPLLAELESFRMDFFNRWGVLLYTTEDVNAPWAGTSGADGEKVPSGTYYVVIYFKNCHNEVINRTQFITVLRN